MADDSKPFDANAILSVDGPDALRVAFDYAGNDLPTPFSIRPSPYRWCDPASLPKREWLMGRYLCRGMVSMTYAPGGTGKSALSVTEAVELASGRDLVLSGVSAPATVWYWNLEEKMDELQRRVQATCLDHRVTQQSLVGRLFCDSGLERGLCLGHPVPGGFELAEAVFMAMETAIRQQGVDVIIIDPFVSSHQLDENNNVQMDALAKRWAKLAAQTNCAVSLVHHTRKSNGDGKITTESGRGAKALSDAARVVRVLNPMTKEQADGYGLDRPDGYVCACLDKQNYAASDNRGDWFHLVGVELGNGEEAVTCQHWRPPDTSSDLSAAQITEIQTLCRDEVPGFSNQADDWAGKIVARVLSLNIKKPRDKARIKSIVKRLLREGYLKKCREPKPGKSETRPIVLPGKEPET